MSSRTDKWAEETTRRLPEWVEGRFSALGKQAGIGENHGCVNNVRKKHVDFLLSFL